MKYIATKDEKGKEEIFLFPRAVHHDCMMEMLNCIKDQKGGNWKRVFREAVSAGFVDGNMNCYGRSDTLNLDSRPAEDTGLLTKQMGG